ncbi:hypothetical protein BDR03DRAFT_1019964 [Suillus americanus]|jgi:hypothetical protein|nr:hypothetical protein BDR03DRAFT_1019964 [Suillus americanus]
MLDGLDGRDITPEVDDGSLLTMDNVIPCSCDSPTLQNIENMANCWQKGWIRERESENKWDHAYEKLLKGAQEKGRRETIIFLNECSAHASEGRELLESIQDVVHTNCPHCRERLKYDIIILHDLLVCIVSEVKFFEVKVANSKTT